MAAQLPARREPGQWIGNYFPIKNASGAVSQVGVIVVDVTPRHLNEPQSVPCEAENITIPHLPPGRRLTARETDVVRLLAHGKRTKEIAAALSLAAKTMRELSCWPSCGRRRAHFGAPPPIVGTAEGGECLEAADSAAHRSSVQPSTPPADAVAHQQQELAAARSKLDIDAVFVTLEPNGGSQHPSGKQLLFAYLRVDPNHP